MAEEVNVEDKIFQAYLDDENLFREEAELMAEDPDEIKSLLKQVRETTGRLRQIAVEYLIRIPDTSPMYRVIWENLGVVLEQGDDPDLTRAISNGLEQGRIKRADWGLVDTILRTVQENSVDLSTRCGLVYALSKAPNEFSKQIQAVLQKLTQSPEKSLRDEAIYSLNYRKKPVRPTEVWIIPGRANSTTRYLASHSTNQKIHWQADTRHLTLSMDGKPHLILKVKLDPEYATEFRFVRVTMGAVFWFLVQELGDDWYLGKCHVPAEMVEVLQQYEDDIRVEMPSIDENDLPDIDLPGIRQAIADAPEEIGKDAVAMLPEAIRKLL